MSAPRPTLTQSPPEKHNFFCLQMCQPQPGRGGQGEQEVRGTELPLICGESSDKGSTDTDHPLHIFADRLGVLFF